VILSKAFIGAGIILAATAPFWVQLPLLNYLFWVLVMMAAAMAGIEKRKMVISAAVVVAMVIGMILQGAFTSVEMILLVLLTAVLPTVLTGALISDGWRAWKAFTVGAILMSLLGVYIYWRVSPLFMAVVDDAELAMRQWFTSNLALLGYATETINAVADGIINTGRLIKHLLPGMFILFGLTHLWIAILWVEWFYTRRDGFFPGFGPFIYWKIPEKLLYFLGVALIVRLLTGGGAELAADNFIFVLFVCYAVCGLALIEHFLRRLRMPFPVRVIFYVGLTFMYVPGMMVTSIAGLFDSFFDFRKVRAHTLG
jgi:hypothetical protein